MVVRLTRYQAEKFGRHLRAARKRAGLTAVQVANLVECAQMTVYQIEGGRHFASVSLMARLCNAVGAEWPEWLWVAVLGEVA